MNFKEYINEYTKHTLAELISLRAIPLSTTMMDRLGYLFPDVKAFHLTNHRHLKNLKSIQKKKSQISCFTKGSYELARLPSQPNCLVHIEGDEIISGASDIWSLTDTHNRRWIDQYKRLKNNKMTFMIDGYLNKMLFDYDENINVEKMKPRELQKFIEELPSADRAKVYKDYHDNIEKYIDGGGYRSLNSYLKNSALLKYNEIIMNNIKIIYVKSIDFDRPEVQVSCEKLNLEYDGFITSSELSIINK